MKNASIGKIHIMCEYQVKESNDDFNFTSTQGCNARNTCEV